MAERQTFSKEQIQTLQQCVQLEQEKLNLAREHVGKLVLEQQNLQRTHQKFQHEYR